MTATPAEVPNGKGKGKSPSAKPAAAPTAAPTNEPPKSLKLPRDLRGVHDELLRALITPVPAVWDDAVTYVDAKQPAAVAKVLVKALHPELVNAKIAYLFRKSIKSGDRALLGKSSKIGGKTQFFTELDLSIEINWDKWQNLTSERRIAMMDHQLTHFTRGESSYEMVGPDIEEFGSIVRRWGLWTSDIQRFASSVKTGEQLDIFAAPIADASAPVTQ